MKNFRDLEVWTHAHKLTLNAYQRTRDFPSDERFGITSQIRRSAASIPANIAGGCGRRGDAEFHRFLQMAMGSASELEYHRLLARDLNYLKAEHHATIEQETVRVRRMLASLLRKVDEDPREKSNSEHISCTTLGYWPNAECRLPIASLKDKTAEPIQSGGR